jgi:hypothetical protein
MKLSEVLPKDFDFILKLTPQNMEKIVTKEWNDTENKLYNALY